MRSCVQRAGLQGVLKVVDIPSANLKRKLVRNRAYDRTCPTQATDRTPPPEKWQGRGVSPAVGLPFVRRSPPISAPETSHFCSGYLPFSAPEASHFCSGPLRLSPARLFQIWQSRAGEMAYLCSRAGEASHLPASDVTATDRPFAPLSLVNWVRRDSGRFGLSGGGVRSIV